MFLVERAEMNWQETELAEAITQYILANQDDVAQEATLRLHLGYT